MKKSEYTHLISQNIATIGSKTIGVYNSNGVRMGNFPLQNLRLPIRGNKLYSFGSLADIHITYETAKEDFETALSYFVNDVKVDFICICGDLTADGEEHELALYKSIIDEYDVIIEAIAGNHEKFNLRVLTEGIDWEAYIGRPLYYTFERDDDVFIMCGCYSSANGYVFTDEYLQWLYETLEANRNKRCFVFQHVFLWEDSGNANELYYNDNFSGNERGNVFKSLLQHYKNTIFFHGHSHMRFDLQEVDEKANYNESLGFRSIHIPSLSAPRDIISGELSPIYSQSEGYVVDVYENGIHLRGRDFVKEEYLPIASYWIDTTLVNIEANTYTDTTGTIETN